MKIRRLPTPMELCDYLMRKGISQKAAITKSQIYYYRIIKPLEALPER